MNKGYVFFNISNQRYWYNKTSCLLTSSSSIVKTRGCGLAWRWSRSLCPNEWCEWIWAMPQQCLWPSKGSLPALMFLRDCDTSGYSAVCWGQRKETETFSNEKKQDGSYATSSRNSPQTLLSHVNSASSPALMVMMILSHTASLNFLPRMSSMGLLWPPMVRESSNAVPSHRLVR